MSFASRGLSEMAAVELSDIELVCSVCGSGNLFDYSQRGIDNWPLARCRNHAQTKSTGSPYVPLMSARAWQGRKKLRHNDKPIDLFGGLSIADQAALSKPVKLK